MTSIGCAATTAPEPEWPRKPSPSYPSQAAAEPTPEAPADPQPSSTDEAPAPSHQLAKQYDGRQAIDVSSGKATYYADSLAGNHTANGDVYDPGEHTAAHKKLPFGTIVRVIRQDTRAMTYVKINDRGPFGPADRIIDLSKAAARDLSMLKAGVVPVRLEVVERPPLK